jgi:hypothetical protein
MNILDCLRVDDRAKLAPVLLQTENIDVVFMKESSKVPQILESHPTFAVVAAFLGASACFGVFEDLAFDHLRVDSAGRSLDHFAAAGGNFSTLQSPAPLRGVATISLGRISAATPSCTMRDNLDIWML